MPNDNEQYEIGSLILQSGFEVLYIKNVTIEENVNEHGKMAVRFLAKGQHTDEDILRHQGSKISLHTSDGDTVFAGICTKIRLLSENEYAELEIIAMTASILTDSEKKDHTFQDTTKTMNSVFSKGIAASALVQIDEDIEIPEMLSQSQETDWEFARRIANQYHKQLFVHSKTAGCQINVGNAPFKNVEPSIILGSASARNVDKVRDIQGNIDNTASVFEYEEIILKVSDLTIGVGYKMTWKGHPHIVTHSKIRCIKGLLQNELTLTGESGIRPSAGQTMETQGVQGILTGKVLEIRGTDVKVDFGEQGDSPRWIPYANTVNNYFYCMPDKGDMVFVYYETGDSDKMVCLGSRHVNDSSDFDRYQDKMLTADNRMIKFGEHTLELVANRKAYNGEGGKQAKIIFNNNEGIEIQADAGICIETTEKGKITLTSGTIGDAEKKKREDIERKFRNMHTNGNQKYIVSGGTVSDPIGKQNATDRIEKNSLPMLSDTIGNAVGEIAQKSAEIITNEQEGIIDICGATQVVLEVGTSNISFIGNIINIKADRFRELGTDRSKTYEHLEDENCTWKNMLLDGAQLVLDIVGALPFPGIVTVANLANAKISLARGRYAATAMSAAMAVASFVIGANTALQAGKTVSKAVNTVTRAVDKLGKVGKGIKGAVALTMGASIVTVVEQGIQSSYDIYVAVKQDRFTLEDPECRKDLIDALRGASILGLLGYSAHKVKKNSAKKAGDMDAPERSRAGENNKSRPNTVKEQGTNLETSKKDLDPVDMVTGSYIIQQCDFIINDITGRYIVERNYESVFSEVDSPIGKGWNLSLFGRAYIYDDKIEIVLPDNHTDTFNKTDTGFKNRRGGSCKRTLKAQEDGYVMHESLTGLSYTYDSDGKLLSVTDRNGNSRSYAYTGKTLNRITFASGQYLDFVWQQDKVLSITDKIGRKVCYHYNEGLLTEVELVNGGVEKYTYDTYGRVAEVIDACGALHLHNEYDQKGRVTRQILSNGQEYIMLYNDDDRTNTCLVPANHKEIKYIYDRNKYLIRTEYADGTTEERGYDIWENIILDRDRNGRETKRIYNEYGHLLEEIKPNSLKTIYEYDDEGNCIHMYDSAGLDISYRYDNRGNLVYEREQITDSLQREVCYSYDRSGRIVSFTDANGNREEYRHNSEFWESTAFINAEGSIYEHQLDEAGRCVVVKGPDGKSSYAYNSYDIVCMETDPIGHTTRYLYNHMSDLVGKVRPNHHASGQENEKKEQYTYDGFHHLLTRIDETGAVYAVHRDGEGNIIKEISPNTYDRVTGDGAGIEYTYDANDKNDKTRYPDGGVLRKWYDAVGNVIKICTPSQYNETTDSGKGYTYTYDCMDRLVQVTAPDNTVLKRYVYDLRGNVIKVISAKGMLSGETDEERIGELYVYNYLGWLIESRIPVSKKDEEVFYRLTKYAYDKAGNRIQERRFCEYQTKDSESGTVHTISYTYDMVDRLIKVSDCTGAVLEYRYDGRNRRIYEKRRINNTADQVTRYIYDAGGRLVELIRTADKQGCGKSSVSVKYTYDKNGNNIKTTLPTGAQILRQYDAVDRLVSERHIDKENGIDNTTQFLYDKAGNLTGITDNQGRITQIEYDLMNREIKRTERDGSVTRQFYDIDGRLAKIIRPNEYQRAGEEGRGLQYTYDAQGNILTVIRPDGTIQESNTYDADGQLLHTQDGTGNGVNIEYDLGGRRTRIATNGKASQQYQYDAAGNITGIIDGAGNHTEYILDKWGRIVEIRKADGSSEIYGYDYAGNITHSTDGEGNTTTYEYNSINQLAMIAAPTGEQEIYHYDVQERLCSKTDRNGVETRYIYNIYDSLIERKAKNPASGEELSENYGYTPEGLLKSAIAQGMRYSYAYDAVGRLIEKKASGRTLLSFRYDQNGNLTHQTDVTGKVTEYRYDLMDNISEVWDDGNRIASYEYNADDTIKRLNNGSLYTEYTYDADRNLTGLKTVLGEDIITDNKYTYDGNGNRIEKYQKYGKISYHYDSMNRLNKVQYPDTTEELFYDKAGNRTRRLYNEAEELYQYDRQNRLVMYTKGGVTTQYEYDKAGNLLKDDKARYEYDAFNRNTKVETFNGNIQINRYDAEGLRHEIEENGRLVFFIFCEGEIVTEESQEDRIRYIRTNTLIASDAESARTYYHYASDEMGSITHVVDSETEEILNRYAYDAWGNPTVCEEKIPNRFRFNGQQYDSISQQYYLRARYYNPVIGRFTQEDTYRGDGLNLYAYCANNPVYYVDPSGHFCQGTAERLGKLIDEGGLKGKNRSRVEEILREKIANGTILPWEQDIANKLGIKTNVLRAKATNKLERTSNISFVNWTNHGYKHFPNKNLSWNQVVESTKSGPAKYHLNIVDIERFEREAWSSGTPTTNGKNWKVKVYEKIVGATEGKETCYVRIECSSSTIHGHPISKKEYNKLLK